jgi:hypothetical protein
MLLLLYKVRDYTQHLPHLEIDTNYSISSFPVTNYYLVIRAFVIIDARFYPKAKGMLILLGRCKV